MVWELSPLIEENVDLSNGLKFHPNAFSNFLSYFPERYLASSNIHFLGVCLAQKIILDNHPCLFLFLYSCSQIMLDSFSQRLGIWIQRCEPVSASPRGENVWIQEVWGLGKKTKPVIRRENSLDMPRKFWTKNVEKKRE